MPETTLPGYRDLLLIQEPITAGCAHRVDQAGAISPEVRIVDEEEMPGALRMRASETKPGRRVTAASTSASGDQEDRIREDQDREGGHMWTICHIRMRKNPPDISFTRLPTRAAWRFAVSARTRRCHRLLAPRVQYRS